MNQKNKTRNIVTKLEIRRKVRLTKPNDGFLKRFLDKMDEKKEKRQRIANTEWKKEKKFMNDMLIKLNINETMKNL